MTRGAYVSARTMAGTGRAGERPVATGSPASNSSKLPVFNPTIVAYVVCPGQLHALAENAKFHLPLSDITDSWNPRIGKCISQGSARETEPAGMCIRRLTARNRLVHLGASPKPPLKARRRAGLGHEPRLRPREGFLLPRSLGSVRPSRCLSQGRPDHRGSSAWRWTGSHPKDTFPATPGFASENERGL